MASDAGKNPQEVMLEQLSSAFNAIPFNKMLGLKLDHISPERVMMNFRMKEELIGNFLQGILHGGVISSVLDMAGGMAAMAAAIYKNHDYTVEEMIEIIGKTSTIDLQISYLRPGRGEFFIAKAWLVKSGRKITFVRMELTNNEGTLIATGSATYLLK